MTRPLRDTREDAPSPGTSAYQAARAALRGTTTDTTQESQQ